MNPLEEILFNANSEGAYDVRIKGLGTKVRKELLRNQRRFRARLRDICERYNREFDSERVIDLDTMQSVRNPDAIPADNAADKEADLPQPAFSQSEEDDSSDESDIEGSQASEHDSPATEAIEDSAHVPTEELDDPAAALAIGGDNESRQRSIYSGSPVSSGAAPRSVGKRSRDTMVDSTTQRPVKQPRSDYDCLGTQSAPLLSTSLVDTSIADECAPDSPDLRCGDQPLSSASDGYRTIIIYELSDSDTEGASV